jgi:hypothetical protein
MKNIIKNSEKILNILEKIEFSKLSKQFREKN